METGSYRKRYGSDYEEIRKRKKYYNISILQNKEYKFLKIEMRAELYNVLKEFGVNFDDFSKGEKIFDKDKDRFMNMIEMMGGKVEIVSKDFVHKTLFSNDEVDIRK